MCAEIATRTVNTIELRKEFESLETPYRCPTDFNVKGPTYGAPTRTEP